jgi:hypothetical protein
VLSPPLFVATCVLWARGRTRLDVYRYAGPVDAASSQRRVQFYSGEGVIVVSRVLRERTIGPPGDPMGGGLASYPIDPRFSRPFTGFNASDPRPLGFGLARSVTVDPPTGPWEQRWTHTAVSVPHWFVALLLIVSPVRWTLSRLATRRRRRAGRCSACGYDLRASGDRCPECGVATPGEGIAV